MYSTTELRYADVFCGLGAFHTAFDRHNQCHNKMSVRYTCVWACDSDEGVRGLYRANYGILPDGDIHHINIEAMPDFDILCAGFPCQPFSVAGKRRGFNDEAKGMLFYKILEVVDKKQPSTLLLENVRNLLTIHHGATFQMMRDELIKRGYHVSHKVLDSRHYNSPQSRQRLYIVCDKTRNFIFREVNRPIVPVKDIIQEGVATCVKYQALYHLQPCQGGGMMKYKLIHKRSGKGGRQGERVYDISKCGPTICASSGGLGAKTGLYEMDDGRIRTLTVKEAMRMFGFDDTYKRDGVSDSRMLFYIGNSIVVSVLEEIIKDLAG